MKNALLTAAFGATVLLQLCSVPSYASNPRTWVSHTGNDGNPCTQASPCLTFAGALAQTAANGEIDCLDAGDYAPTGFTITTSVTIDCHGTNATIENPFNGSAVVINATNGTVVLRGLNISHSGIFFAANIGINIMTANVVQIEDCVIMAFNQGVSDVRTGGLTQLFIKNTVVRDNGQFFAPPGPGILLAAGAKNSVVLENVQSISNGFGIAVATGNNVVISRSVFSENKVAGIEADSGAQVMVNNSEISHNASYGIIAQGTVGLANSDISFNSSSIFGSATSYGNNRLLGNGAGTAPTPAGGASTDLGQQ